MQYVLTEHELRRFATEVAGAASVPFMKAAPKLVMPTEEQKTRSEANDKAIRAGIPVRDEPQA